MEALSIAVTAYSIAALCGKVISNVSRFVVDVQSMPQTLDEFNRSISVLKTVLNNIDCVINKKPRHVLFGQKQERKHWQDVRNVLEACNSCLYKLDQEIPEPPTDNHRMLQQARIQLELSLKSNVVVQIRGHITSYTQILQLSLTTMSLGSIWETQQSQDLVRSEIQKLTAEIRATNTIFQGRQVEAGSSSCDDLTLAEMLARRNIEAWRESAESLAAAVTLYEPDQQSVAERAEDATAWSEVGFTDRDGNELPRNTSMSQPDSGVEVGETADDWDPEPENTYCLSADIIQYQIAANRENVTKLFRSGLYFQAEQYQKKLIGLQEQLLKTYRIAFPDRADEEELWADILRRQGTKDSARLSKDIFQRLLEQELQPERASDMDKSRCCRYYHKLGEIYIELGWIKKAKDFATRALEGRKRLLPVTNDLVLESARLLANVCQLSQDFDEASGLKAWIRNQEAGTGTVDRAKSLPPNPAMADVLRWCKERGFDVDSPGFSFENPNGSGKTPLHVAVSDEKLEIVEEIVDQAKSLETQDNDQATALLLACSTRNRCTTSVLLKKGAKVGVQDNYRNTPLHRVQSATGGTAVARLLLDSPSHLNINQKNIYDKTALHLACEMGNEPMVDVLLEHGADPNCQGPAKCTPLHVAIESRRVPIVKKLLEKGADTEIRDSSGRDAATTTRTTRRLPPEITKLVQHHTNQLRRLSHVKSLEPPSEQERKSSTSVGMASMDILEQRRESGFSLASRAKSLKLRLMPSNS